jgi:hypothetical protein
MHGKKGFCSAVAVMIFLLVAVARGDQGTGNPTPSLITRGDAYLFKPVPDGVEIHHTFNLLNKGNALLEIQNVRTD